MKIKSVIIVIFISMLIGAGIFFVSSRDTTGELARAQIAGESKKASSEPTQEETQITPLPSFPPIDRTTNLAGESGKLTPSDFSEDFKSLRNTIATF